MSLKAKSLFSALLLTCVFISTTAFAGGTGVIEGDEAKKLFASKKGEYPILMQKDKTFTLRKPDGSEEKNQKSLK